MFLNLTNMLSHNTNRILEKIFQQKKEEYQILEIMISLSINRIKQMVYRLRKVMYQKLESMINHNIKKIWAIIYLQKRGIFQTLEENMINQCTILITVISYLQKKEMCLIENYKIVRENKVLEITCLRRKEM